MSKTTRWVILLIIKYITLFACTFIFAAFATGNLPLWCSPWNALWIYIIYVITVLVIDFKYKWK